MPARRDRTDSRADGRGPSPAAPEAGPARTEARAAHAEAAAASAAADVKRFAELVKAKERAEQAARQAERDRVAAERAAKDAEQSAQQRLAQVRDGKDRAARRVKELRARGAASASIAEAEAEYRDALGLLMAVERGEDPALLVVASDEPEQADADGLGADLDAAGSDAVDGEATVEGAAASG
jgi:hypothetical protein